MNLDPIILKELEPFQQIVDAIGKQPVGYTTIPLEKPLCSISECNYGNLVNDAYIDYVSV